MRKFGSLSSSASASMRWARERTAAAFSSVSATEVSEFSAVTSALASILFKRAADRIDEFVRRCGFGAVIAGSLLRGHLHMRIGRDKFVRNRNAFDDLDALARQRIVLHGAHRDETVDALEAEPVDHVRHQLLEARVLHAGHAFSALEILRSRVAAFLTFARVVDKEFRDLAERTAFLAVVDDDAEAAFLPGARAFLDAMNQIGAAGADVGAEHVGTVALVMHATGDLGAMVGQLGDVAEQIGRCAADRRQEDLQVGPCHQFGKHARGLLEQLPAQIVFGGRKPLRQTRKVPHRVDGDLDDGNAAVLVNDFAVVLQPSGVDRRPELRQIEAGAGDRDARPDVDSLGDFAGKIFRDEMTPGIERDNALRLAPLRERTDRCRRMRVGEIGSPDRVERARGDREWAVDRIGAAMGADDVAVLRAGYRADDRTALARAGRAPLDRELELAARRRMRSDPDMVNPVGTSHRGPSFRLDFLGVVPSRFSALNGGLKWRRPA